METRHAQDVALSALSDRSGLRLHGRDDASSESGVSNGSGASDDAVDRARAAHRFDRRGPALRLVHAEPVIRQMSAPSRPTDPVAAIGQRLAAIIGPERYQRVFAGQVKFVVTGSTLEARALTKAGAGVIERRFAAALREAVVQVLGNDAEIRFVVDVPANPGADSVTEIKPGRAITQAPLRSGSRAPTRAYRFDDFVVGPSNSLAYNAALQVAEAEPSGHTGQPGSHAVPPLLIHGPCGVGKTHLLHAVAQRFRERHPGAVVRIVTGETFLNEFITAIGRGGGSSMTGQSRAIAGSGGVERFRKTYRRCDLLCIDDVHFLASKQATQQELLHTFDQIAQSGAKIVLASDCHPREMKSGDGGFSPALVSRFLSGMVAGIDAPDASVRERAARLFAQRRGVAFEDGALRMIVDRTESIPGQTPVTIRDLEGLLTRIEAVRHLAQDEGRLVGVLTVERAITGAGGHSTGNLPVRRPLRAEQIIAQTIMALGVDRADLSAPTRHKRVVLARAVITHLCRDLTTMSFPEIARAIGRPSHSTVITAHQRLQRQIAEGEVFGIGPGGEAMTVGGLVRQLAAALTRG